ncbi:TPA: hypothetical protein F8R99_14215 [Legionella pneumophila]|nr:hypothetical protein [Legionella pneumophila]
MTFYHLNVFWSFFNNPIIQLIGGENERPINTQHVLYYTNTGQYPKSWIRAITMGLNMQVNDGEIWMSSLKFSDDIGVIRGWQNVGAYVAFRWVGA